jgi:hypothetical protein
MTSLAQIAFAAFAVVLSLVPAPMPAHAQGRSPFIGTWAFNAKASTPTANTYKYRRIVISEAGRSLAFTIEEALMDGPDIRWGFTTMGDGKPTAVQGIAALDSVSATIEGRSGTFEYRKGATVMTNSRIEVSEDGAVLTITSTRTMSDGTAVKARTQYDRQ